ncbi:hypothetical protein OPT61_g8696 [Boeremia exigua]|uniref:Uncharacterized protein n=1 Tax=Boeremia exigua TaxID=749465 RepID=A0ACC2HYV4_9PLEO|nr:hypothetical protein OPT61_g8696 [Boeremia exigua]
MSAPAALEIAEHDEAGNVVATYLTSGDARVDVVVRNFLGEMRGPQAPKLTHAGTSRNAEQCAAAAGSFPAGGVSTQRHAGLCTIYVCRPHTCTPAPSNTPGLAPGFLLVDSGAARVARCAGGRGRGRLDGVAHQRAAAFHRAGVAGARGYDSVCAPSWDCAGA